MQSAVVELKSASKWRRRTGAGYTSLDKITGAGGCINKKALRAADRVFGKIPL